MARRKNSRAASHRGSLRQRKNDGLWEGRYSYTDELGQPQRGSVYGHTQRECVRKLDAIIAEINEGVFQPTTEHYTVKEWLAEWLKTYCLNLKPSTQADYARKAERYIIPNIGTVQLQSLSSVQIQKFCNLLSAGKKGQKPVSAKTVQNIHGILHSALKRAVQVGLIRTNPASNTSLPKVKKPELKPLMDEDIKRYLEQIENDEFRNLLVVGLFCGLRQSELLGLQWEDIDFQAGKIEVRRQLQKDPNSSNYIFLDETKNGKSRTVYMPSMAIDALKQERYSQNEHHMENADIWSNPHNLVFTDIIGGHLKHHTVYNHHKKAVAAIGVPECRFHDLRHSAATLMMQTHVPVKFIQEQMGHYSSSFTMDVYGAVSNTMQKNATKTIDDAIEHILKA